MSDVTKQNKLATWPLNGEVAGSSYDATTKNATTSG